MMYKNLYSSSLNIKIIFHRSLLILPALASAYDIQLQKYSSYNIIEQLQKKEVLNKELERNLTYAVAIASFVRLKMYSSAKGQNDYITNKYIGTHQSPLHDVIDQVGAEPLLEFLASLHHLQAKVMFSSLTDDELLEMRFRFMDDLFLHEQILQEWKQIQTDNTNILRRTIDASADLGKFDDMIECCYRLALQDCNDEDFVSNKQYSALYLSFIEYYVTHRFAAGCLWDAINFIEQKPNLLQLHKNQEFFDSNLCDVFLAYFRLGVINLDLGDYKDAQVYLEKANCIHCEHIADFDTNNYLLDSKINLLFHLGKCHTLLGNLDKGLSLLEKSLTIVERETQNDLYRFLLHLYHMSWNFLIDGKLCKALDFINCAIDIIDKDKCIDEEDFDDIRAHQHYVTLLQKKVMSSSFLLYQYRFNHKLTPWGYPNEGITAQVSLCLHDLLFLC